MRSSRERKKLSDSFSAAGRGILLALFSERNVRIHFAAAGYAVAFGAIGQIGAVGFAILALIIGLVIGAEMLNSAIERICDMYTREYDRRVRDIKDISSGAVLVCACISVAVAIVLFTGPETLGRILTFFSNWLWLTIFLASIPFALIFIFMNWGKK